ncbi:MAG: CooT family nickel-binding protein [Actinomycetota bacterium]|nr:CooT family nickel-binding protein [Actinomycetota bacterium]
MCEASVYTVRDGERNLVMENVVSIRPEGEKVILVDIFGDQKVLAAKIEKVDLLEHEVILCSG